MGAIRNVGREYGESVRSVMMMLIRRWGCQEVLFMCVFEDSIVNGLIACGYPCKLSDPWYSNFLLYASVLSLWYLGSHGVLGSF